MISQKTLELNWLKSVSEKNRKTDIILIEKYSTPEELKDWKIELPLSTKLNKLKKSNPEAFYYWYKIYETMR